MDSQTYYRYARPEVAELVPLDARRILDVGCGAGVLGATLKSRQDCAVTGIEIVREAAEEAIGRLDRVLCGELFLVAEHLPDAGYDAIIMADVLEHLPDSDQVLGLLASKLAQKGRLILSIPNVRHWSVIQGLLEGDWKYEDSGLLDRTHLRFFTHRSLIRTLANNGFFPETTTATRFFSPAPSGLSEALSELNIQSGSLEEESAYYQYLLVCGRQGPASLSGHREGNKLQARSLFYLAEYYQETAKTRQALETYRLRCQYDSHDEETWLSFFRLAVLTESLGEPRTEVIYAYWCAFQHRPNRAEPLVQLARIYRESQEFVLAQLCARRAIQLDYPTDTGYVDAASYLWKAADEYAVSSYWLGDYSETRRVCQELLANDSLPVEQRQRIRDNLNFALQALGQSSS
jgi:2-polyprenyl-3-methyl-5-hydroxy-6-metoxy-1,4-benzoquinol methylase